MRLKIQYQSRSIAMLQQPVPTQKRPLRLSASRSQTNLLGSSADASSPARHLNEDARRATLQRVPSSNLRRQGIQKLLAEGRMMSKQKK